MKKLSYIILGFLIGAFATYYLCPRQADVDESSTNKVSITKPKGVITPTQAKGLNNNWTKHREAAVDSAAHRQDPNIKKDNRSTWWSLSDIEDYIAYAKNQTSDLGYNITGMRVYLGVYGKNAGQSKKNLTTMFIVPTVKNGTANASMSPFTFQNEGKDCPECDPMNDGTGGGGSYPQ